ncbi:uncharacterized protein GGS25DRAFT_305583 [Hypoxylon fragiforme]|uniref:uncharacterized protein n=1 Tax=Hypoxylon fragiforme TaxID=63214 RepID=UPI0020C72884|nr:uncharacterized protein GGS25DRAFT_305583 [Hypoxylon fragiforme]KAI2609120.1 hypothetical protein GGS25DRAFT_305583 [Hypoxylon fragiforme]
MCHGHPHYHPCSHTSVKWLYCPEAMFDLDTGYETPCSNPIYSTPQPTNVDCPLQTCNFKALMGSWNCCVCGQGPNTQGWCTALCRRMDWNPLTGNVEDMEVSCGHGCCSSCSPSTTPRNTSPEISFADIRKGKTGRKAHSTTRGSAHRRGAAYDFSQNNDSCPTVPEEGDQLTSPSTATPSSRGSRRSSHDPNMEYSKKPKMQNGKKKSHKGRIHY